MDPNLERTNQNGAFSREKIESSVLKKQKIIKQNSFSSIIQSDDKANKENNRHQQHSVKPKNKIMGKNTKKVRERTNSSASFLRDNIRPSQIKRQKITELSSPLAIIQSDDKANKGNKRQQHHPENPGDKIMGKNKKVRERTYIMIELDGVLRDHVGQIITRFENEGLKLVGIKLCMPGKEMFKKHNWYFNNKKVSDSFSEQAASNPVCCMVWEGDNAVLIGKKTLDATIRGDFCIDVGKNVIHGSDSVDSANKQITSCFKPWELVS